MAIPQAAEAHPTELRRAESHASGNDGASARPLLRRIQAVHAAGLLPDSRPAGDAGHLRPIPCPWRQRRDHASHGRIAGASGDGTVKNDGLIFPQMDGLARFFAFGFKNHLHKQRSESTI